MRHAALLAVLALFSAWALTSSGCWKKSKAPAPAAAPAAPTEPKPAQLTGTPGELQNIAANWRELQPEMDKNKLAFKVVAAKAWAIAGSVDQIMKLAERATGSPAVPPKGASAEEVRKLGFAVGMGDDKKIPEIFRDVELIGINAKNLAAAANGLDTDEARKWWEQLDHLCESVCGGVAPPAPAPAPAVAPAPTPAPKPAPEAKPAPVKASGPASTAAGKQ